MANTIFVADNTIPGLGASDLARLGFGVAGSGFVGSMLSKRGLRVLSGTDTKQLRDLGVVRESC